MSTSVDLQLTVIIPQFNQSHLTIQCCSSLLRHHPKARLLIVDDGSSPRTLQSFRAICESNPRLSLISQTHRGVTAAWNNGLQHTRTPYAVLLNNDTTTLAPWLPHIIGHLSHHPTHLIGLYKREEPILGRSRFSTQLLSGCCLAFSLETFCKVGPFDESMQLYWSDTDWLLRWQQSYLHPQLHMHLLPDNHLRHAGHQTTRRLSHRQKIERHDRRTFLKKWHTHLNLPSHNVTGTK